MVDLRRLAEELNIDDIAVCNAEPFLDVESILIKDKLLGILPPFTEEDINNFCKKLPRYKRPRKIIFADVPRNATGKIEKPKLREMYGASGLVDAQNRS